MKNIAELKQKRFGLVTQARSILDTAEKENRSLTGEEEQMYDRIDADIDGLTKEIEREERQQSRETEMSARSGSHFKPDPSMENGTEKRNVPTEQTEEYRNAFLNYVRNGFNSLSAEERQLIGEKRALGVGTGSSGGFTVPSGFYQKLIDAQKFFGGMRQSKATVFQTASGNPLPIATDDDTSNIGAILAENAQAPTQDVAFNQVTLGAYKYTSKVLLVSIELLQDSAFDLETWIATKLGQRIGRATNNHFTVGTGSGQPKGIVTAANLGKTGANGQTTSIVYDDLIDLEHSVDVAYRGNAQYMFHDSTLKVLKKLKDSYGRPLWLPGLADKEPDTINGFQYVINNDMPVMAANAKSVIFGDLSTYYIRDVMDVMVVRMAEKYADSGQVGFVAFSRHDGNLVDAGQHPVAYYANSAT